MADLIASAPGGGNSTKGGDKGKKGDKKASLV